MPLDLGRTPEYMRIRLSLGAPFLLSIDPDEPKEFDTAPHLEFPTCNTVWLSTLTPEGAALFAVDAAEVDYVVANSSKRSVRLWHGPLLWAEGKFEIDRDPIELGTTMPTSNPTA